MDTVLDTKAALVQQLIENNDSLGSRTCKPNSVCRKSGRTVIPLGYALLRSSSDLPGGWARRAGTRSGRSRNSLPIWSCSVWGLPCPLHYCRGGALLPHLFTLTSTSF